MDADLEYQRVVAKYPLMGRVRFAAWLTALTAAILCATASGRGWYVFAGLLIGMLASELRKLRLRANARRFSVEGKPSARI